MQSLALALSLALVLTLGVSSSLAQCDDDCNCYCDSEISFVCGSDGVSYQSECLLRQAACETKQDIDIAFDGWCSSVDRSTLCPSDCEDVGTHRVCDTAFNRFDNICSLMMASCGRRKTIVYHRKHPKCR